MGSYTQNLSTGGTVTVGGALDLGGVYVGVDGSTVSGKCTYGEKNSEQRKHQRHPS